MLEREAVPVISDHKVTEVQSPQSTTKTSLNGKPWFRTSEIGTQWENLAGPGSLEEGECTQWAFAVEGLGHQMVDEASGRGHPPCQDREVWGGKNMVIRGPNPIFAGIVGHSSLLWKSDFFSALTG